MTGAMPKKSKKDKSSSSEGDNRKLKSGSDSSSSSATDESKVSIYVFYSRVMVLILDGKSCHVADALRKINLTLHIICRQMISCP